MQFASICEDVVSRFILVPLISKELPLNKGLNALRQFVERERFNDSLKIVAFTRICMENHASVTGWQKLSFSYKCF